MRAGDHRLRLKGRGGGEYLSGGCENERGMIAGELGWLIYTNIDKLNFPKRACVRV